MNLRESTSRKRRVSAALRGEQPPLPGSYAANPRTDVKAMKSASKTGVVQKFKESDTPNYSIDRWIDMTNDLGKDLSTIRQDSEEEEKKLDKDIDAKKKDIDVETKEADKETKKDNEKEEEAADEKDEKEIWNKIKKHLDKSKVEKGSSPSKASSKASSGSSSRSSASSSST